MPPPDQMNHPTPESSSPRASMRMVGIVVGVLLIIGAGAIGYVVHDLLDGRAPMPARTPVATEPAGLPEQAPSSPTATTTITSVAWQEPKQVEKGYILKRPIPETPDSYVRRADEYIVGTITQEPYRGAKVHMVFVESSGLGSSDAVYHLIAQGDTFINVDGLSEEEITETWGMGDEKPTILNGFSFAKLEEPTGPILFADLVLPQTIVSPDGRATLVRVPMWGDLLFTPKGHGDQGLTNVFVHPKYGDVYSNNKDGGFTVHVSDGTVATYRVAVPFMSKEGVPSVVWKSNGQTNTEIYADQLVGGCGFGNYADVVEKGQLSFEKDLEPVGEYAIDHAYGVPVYGLKDKNHAMLKDMYAQTKDYYEYYNEGKTLSYQEFLNLHPLFFWQDSFGRLIRFTTNKYPSPAECGKPVIYLYPQEPTEVRVQVRPTGGFSHTEPSYGAAGWQVLAQPSGILTDLRDGSTWPYLFWEGKGNAVGATEERGFVVKRAEVPAFLEEKLATLGLNEKERADFAEFWVPKMSRAPYYFVTFYGNELMDRIAPLAVSPRPESVIRLLMDYRPLAQPIPVAPLPLHTPERSGFTVVEWGGVLRK